MTLILLTNDDGIHAPGLHALRRKLEAVGTVEVIAPHVEQSGTAHSVSIDRPLKLQQVRIGDEIVGHSVDGSPADCVKLGIAEHLRRLPDLLVSGINHGVNTGVNVLYSGTVAAAIEGAMLGVPAIFVSSTRRGFTDEEEEKGLLFTYDDVSTAQEQALAKAKELLAQPDLGDQWRAKSQAYLAEADDVTQWILDFMAQYDPANPLGQS